MKILNRHQLPKNRKVEGIIHKTCEERSNSNDDAITNSLPQNLNAVSSSHLGTSEIRKKNKEVEA